MSEFESNLLNSFSNTDLSTGKVVTPKSRREEILSLAEEKAGLNTAELKDIILDTKPAQLIESIAGSGKTTVLNLKIIADRYSGASENKSIWVNTFLKTGVTDMESSFYKRCQSLDKTIPANQIHFSTLHSEFYNVLKTLGINIEIADAKMLNQLLRAVAKELSLGPNRGYLDPDQLSTLQTLITRYRASLGKMPYTAFEVDDVKLLGITPELLKDIVQVYKNRRRRSNVYDFDDLQELLYDYLIVKPNPALINYISTRYAYIYLDEFQDVSRIQYEILKVYFKGAEQIFAVGDSDQSIYSWRGSDISIITRRFPFDYDPSTHFLTTNYRVPANILDPIANSIKKAPKRVDKAITAAKPGGEFDIVALRTKQQLLKYLITELAKDQQNGKKIAIMASTNATLTDLALFMNMQKKVHYNMEIRGNLVNLDSYKYAKYIRLAYLFTDNTANNYLKQNIESLDYASRIVGASTKLDELIRNEGIQLISLNTQLLQSFSKGLADWGMAINLEGNVKTLGSINRYTDKERYDKIKLKMYYDTLVYLRDKEKKSKSDFSDSNTVVLNLLISAIKFDEDIISTNTFLEKMEFHKNMLKRQFNTSGAQIILTTPFEFKGKETDVTYILEDTNYNFPRRRSEKDAYDEERRLHYIAGTRARQKCVYTTIIGHVSPFIKEMDAPINKPLVQSLDSVVHKFDLKETSAQKDYVEDLTTMFDSEN